MRVPANHPLRLIRRIVRLLKNWAARLTLEHESNEVLAALDSEFGRLYAAKRAPSTFGVASRILPSRMM